MVIAHAATAFWHHFHPWITKNMDLETVSHFGTQHNRKITKLCPRWAQEAPKMNLKSINMYTWTSKCLLGDPLNPWIIKMVTQGTQNGAPRSPK